MAYDPLVVASYYSSVFPARNDVYSHWTGGGWRPVRSPMTPEIVLAGLTGKGPSISGYMIAPGSVTHSVAVDFDSDDGYSRAVQLAATMYDAGIPAYTETSRRGGHLWCVLDAQLPAVAVRAALRGLIQAAHLPDNDPKIEIRPGSDTIADDGLGHCLRLPLMPHPKTGQRGEFVDALGNPVGRSMAEILLNLETVAKSATTFLRWAEYWKRPPVSHVPSRYGPPHEPFPEETSTASELLRSLWGVQNATPGRSVHCPAHDDQMASLSILRDDRRVICKAGYCVLNNDDHGRGTYELRKLAPTSQD